jgi:ribosomal protein S18 acetylase RimI-like enzyme
MMIKRSSIADERRFQGFWRSALAAQRAGGIPLWPDYLAELIRSEIQAGLHFSAYDADERLVGYFSLALADPLIWAQEEKGDALYIHRMCVNPEAKGQRFARHVLSWACGYASGAGRKHVRMDTWRDNARLIDYYVACGFRRVEDRHINGDHRLPAHYADIDLALFQNEL